jgi:hypothetical protein
MFTGQKGVPLERRTLPYGKGIARKLYLGKRYAYEALLAALETGL